MLSVGTRSFYWPLTYYYIFFTSTSKMSYLLHGVNDTKPLFHCLTWNA